METVDWAFLVGMIVFVAVVVIVQLVLDLRAERRRHDWERADHERTIDAWLDSVDDITEPADAMRVLLSMDRRNHERLMALVTRPWEKDDTEADDGPGRGQA